MANGWLMEFLSVFSKFTHERTPPTNLAHLAHSFRGRKNHFFSNYSRFLGFLANLETLELPEWLP